MKVLMILAFCALVASAYGASLDVYDGPVYFDDETLSDMETHQPQLDHKDLIDLSYDRNLDDEQPSFRARRVTCDVLSFKSMWVSPNHSACAVRCLAQRRKGGKCKNGVCVCRG